MVDRINRIRNQKLLNFKIEESDIPVELQYDLTKNICIT
jgi:hypothetical protein